MKTGRRDGGKAGIHEELTVYDPSVPAATRVSGEVVYMKADENLLTTTEMIMVLPTRPAATTGEEGGTTTTTMTSMSTETVMVSIAGQAVASPIVVAGGQQQVPQDDPSGSDASDADQAGGDASNVGEGSELFGVSYAPYRADHNCKNGDDIADDFQQIKGEYSLVRIYGTDCGQVPHVYASAKKIGVKLMMGIWDINRVEDEASMMADGLDGDWDIVHSVSVGNELVNNGQATASDMVDAVTRTRAALRKAGFKGPVVTVDTFIATEAHPELCEASDYCAINAHPFFDSTMGAEDAGKWLQSTIKNVKSKLSKPMDVIVTETGWPTDGAANGLAVPGLENQKIALKSIKSAFFDHPGDIILFSAFDDLWKERTMSTFNADQHWGIGGAISKCDLALI